MTRCRVVDGLHHDIASFFVTATSKRPRLPNLDVHSSDTSASTLKINTGTDELTIATANVTAPVSLDPMPSSIARSEDLDTTVTGFDIVDYVGAQRSSRSRHEVILELIRCCLLHADVKLSTRQYKDSKTLAVFALPGGQTGSD